MMTDGNSKRPTVKIATTSSKKLNQNGIMNTDEEAAQIVASSAENGAISSTDSAENTPIPIAGSEAGSKSGNTLNLVATLNRR